MLHYSVALEEKPWLDDLFFDQGYWKSTWLKRKSKNFSCILSLLA